MTRLSDETLYLFVTTPLDGRRRKFFLEELIGQEQISGLFHYQLHLKSDDFRIDFNQLLGKPVTVHIRQADGAFRFINGVVCRFVQAETFQYVTSYYAEIRPWTWQMTLTTDSRIFQNQSVIDIITTLLSDLSFSDLSVQTKASYPPLEYAVQYQETAFDFMSRLLEEEGICYFFQHTKDRHTLVLADDADAHPPCPGTHAVGFRRSEPQGDGLVGQCRLEQQLTPGGYAAQDYNFKTPDTDLFTRVDAKQPGPYQIYEFPGRFADLKEADRRVKRRIELHERPGTLFLGEGYCRSFTAGHRFKLSDHDRADFNRQWVLETLSITANQDRYTNTFTAFGSNTAYRPARVTRRPKIAGTQTALVVGQAGEEIWTDDYGRIKVQFHWDRRGKSNENSSCWVRVAQVWAGKNWGTLFIPRIGTEAVVSFIDGDPDRPLVIGTVYNASQRVPLRLPNEKNLSTIRTMSTKQGSGGNEIRFDDTRGAEQLFVHAQKDRVTEVENNDTLTVAKNRQATIREENDSLSVEKGNRTIKIAAGTETHDNGADFTHHVAGNYVLEVKGNLTLKAQGEVVIKGALVKIN